MSVSDSKFSHTRIPLVSGAVIAVRRRPWLAYVLVTLALLACGWLWTLQQNDQHNLAASQKKITELENRLGNLQQQQQLLLNDLTNRSRQLDVVEARLTRWDDMLNAGQRHIWLLNEATYYLRLAEQHLTLTRDTKGTRALLSATEQLLAHQADTRFLPLRQALANDQLALAAVNTDISSLYLRLGALSEHINHINIDTSSSPRRTSETPRVPVISESASAWDKGWNKIKQLVIIRHHDSPLAPQLNTTEIALAKEILRLDLAQAQLALLRAEPTIYKESLQTASHHLQQFFPLLPSTEQNALQQELQLLSSTNIHAELPSLTSSLQALEALTTVSSSASMGDKTP